MNNKMLIISISDNGGGFPDNMLNMLTEPYVTTKTKGMGLGLAVAKKIVEDHDGFMQFYNLDKGQACVEITFNMIQ